VSLYLSKAEKGLIYKKKFVPETLQPTKYSLKVNNLIIFILGIFYGTTHFYGGIFLWMWSIFLYKSERKFQYILGYIYIVNVFFKIFHT